MEQDSLSVQSRMSGKTSFLRSAAKVATGHAVGYLVAFAASPLLTRLYTPEAFGVYAIFTMAVSSLGVAASLRLDQTIPLSSTTKRANQLGTSSAIVAISMCLVLLVLSPVLSWVAHACGVSDLPGLFWWLMCVAILCFSSYQVSASLALRARSYRTMADMRIAFAICSTIIHLLIPLSGGSLALGLPAGQAVGFGCGCLVGCWQLRHILGQRCRMTIALVFKDLSKHREFSVYGVPASVLSNLGTHFPVLVIAALFGIDSAGIYAFAQRMFTTPLTLLTNSFSRVYYAEGSVSVVENSLAPLFRSTLTKMSLLAAGPIVCAAVLSPFCFAFLFGENWRAAGWVCTLLAPMAFTFSVSLVASPTYDLVGRQKQRLAGETLCTFLITSGIVAGWLMGWTLLTTVAITSCLGSCGYGLLFWGAKKAAYASNSTEDKAMVNCLAA